MLGAVELLLANDVAMVFIRTRTLKREIFHHATRRKVDSAQGDTPIKSMEPDSLHRAKPLERVKKSAARTEEWGDLFDSRGPFDTQNATVGKGKLADGRNIHHLAIINVMKILSPEKCFLRDLGRKPGPHEGNEATEGEGSLTNLRHLINSVNSL